MSRHFDPSPPSPSSFVEIRSMPCKTVVSNLCIFIYCFILSLCPFVEQVAVHNRDVHRCEVFAHCSLEFIKVLSLLGFTGAVKRVGQTSKLHCQIHKLGLLIPPTSFYCKFELLQPFLKTFPIPIAIFAGAFPCELGQRRQLGWCTGYQW